MYTCFGFQMECNKEPAPKDILSKEDDACGSCANAAFDARGLTPVDMEVTAESKEPSTSVTVLANPVLAAAHAASAATDVDDVSHVCVSCAKAASVE